MAKENWANRAEDIDAQLAYFDSRSPLSSQGYPSCPNPDCDRLWHGNAVGTAGYRDDLGVYGFCPGSHTFTTGN